MAPQEGTKKSEVACHSCRRRKVKCDREFPQCAVCEQTGQSCDYPLRPKKPGPKIGSLQRQKRRHRYRQDDKGEQRRTSCSPPGSQEDGDAEKAVNDATDDLKLAQSEGRKRTSFDSSVKDGAKTRPSENDEWSARRRDSQLNIHDLSFILHPSHEASTPEKDQNLCASKDGNDGKHGLFQQACSTLNITPKMMENMIRTYFENMVAINLFHVPSFLEKLNCITSAAQMNAFLAAIIGYASRFYPFEICNGTDAEMQLLMANLPTPAHFLNLALKHIDEALIECDDEAPPLCVVQALIITTHCQLTRGVHGKAWRSLGLCIRLAYELNLHLVDSRDIHKAEQESALQWRENEEKRRVWWAIWEMDVFASTIRRTPTGMDWAQMEILLPVEDKHWFRDQVSPSCFMEKDPVIRWKALQESGNQSPKAWFLIINSLMKDSQIISSPRGIPFMGHSDHYQSRGGTGRKLKGTYPSPVEDARERLETLANSVQCFGLALPTHLRYRNQYLSFDGPALGQTDSLRQQHCGIYNIYVMTQLARLMIYRYDVFSGHAQAQWIGNTVQNVSNDMDISALRQYFEAADNILTIVNRSCEDHIRHINPFLSSTIWLASAVQLLRKHFDRSIGKTSLIKSRFDVLYLTYKRCVAFWDTQTALQQNLESLEAQLEGGDCKESQDQGHTPQKRTKVVANKDPQHTSWTHKKALPSLPRNYQTDPRTEQIMDKNLYQPINKGTSFDRMDTDDGTRFLPASGLPNSVGERAAMQFSPAQSQEQYSAVNYLKKKRMNQSQNQTIHTEIAGEHINPATLMPTTMLDYVHLPTRLDKNHLSVMDSIPLSPSSMSPMMFDSSNNYDLGLDDIPQDVEWRNMELPSDIHDMLSGFSTY